MIQNYLVEFVGTLFLVFIFLSTGNPLAIGATLALLILLAHNFSGGYMNPAVTIAMASAGQLATADVIPYCLAQIFGGLVALEIYKRVKDKGMGNMNMNKITTSPTS
jgi:glycerol uptake facilitator-like aquaporin